MWSAHSHRKYHHSLSTQLSSSHKNNPSPDDFPWVISLPGEMTTCSLVVGHGGRGSWPFSPSSAVGCGAHCLLLLFLFPLHPYASAQLATLSLQSSAATCSSQCSSRPSPLLCGLLGLGGRPALSLHEIAFSSVTTCSLQF